MGNKSRAISRVYKKYKKSPEFRAKYLYTAAVVRGDEIDKNCVLLQSFDGSRFGGAPFYILEAMESDTRLQHLKKIVAVKSFAIDDTLHLLSCHGFDDCKVVELHSAEYCSALATARYLINNSTFPTYFTKRASQRYLNTWHGTPLKSMGRKIADKPWGLGNTQRNFLMADYLLYSNEHTFEHFIEDYMLKKHYQGTYLLGGYPSNDVFFDNDRRERIRTELGLEDKKIIAYMPTWRSKQKGGHSSKHQKMTEFALMNLDEHLGDEYVVFAQIHYYDATKPIEYNKFKRVYPFPKEYETYELLNIADVLITDYSSVMFDYMNLNKEIILFDYDREEYFETRGTYISVTDLPFWRSNDIYEICRYINSGLTRQSNNYSEMKKQFCPFDSARAAKNICSLLFDNDDSSFEVIEGKALHNVKKNILIFTGALKKNGLTSSLQGLLENLDYEKANYILTFKSSNVKSSHDFFASLDNRIDYFPMQGSIPMTYREALSRFRYYRQNCTSMDVRRDIVSLFNREAERCFPGMKFDSVIHFTGYERDMVHILLGVNADNRVMYVHSDMAQEGKKRKNFHVPSLVRAYREFDRIAVVREGLVDVMNKAFSIPREKIKVVHNANMSKQICKRAMEPVSFDEDTVSNISLARLDSILSDRSITKFISIGRFSPEKGLLRLISAYKKYVEKNPSTSSVLIIIGGHGPEFKDVLEASKGNEGIIVIKSLSNPYAVLKRADVFVMSSFYEGLPMSIIEALILDKPVICTSIDGPREFLQEGYGYLVDNSEEGLYSGLCDWSSGNIGGLVHFDVEKFNAVAMDEFYSVTNL